MGPMEILYCWQSLFLASIVHLATRSVKNAILLQAGRDQVKLAWAKHVILPLVPLFLGVVVALSLPVRPEALVKYAQADGLESSWPVYACYGAVLGVFADYIHHRLSGLLEVRTAGIPGKDDSSNKPSVQ